MRIYKAEEVLPELNPKGLVLVYNRRNSRAFYCQSATHMKEGKAMKGALGNPSWQQNANDIISVCLREEDLTLLRDRRLFEGQVLLNLGCGGYLSTKTSLDLAIAGEAEGMILVDPFYQQEAARAVTLLKDTTALKVAVIQEDMLSFLKRVPNASVSLLCSGIEYPVINQDYAQKVSREMSRVLHVQGYALIKAGTIVRPASNHLVKCTKTLIPTFDIYGGNNVQRK